MNKDITRWIEVAAMTDCVDQCDTSCGGCKAAATMAIHAFLQAAAADGVKLVPEAATEAMKDEGWQVDGCHPHDVWEAMWHHTPNYLDDDA